MPVVDMSFRLGGTIIPADHAYFLLSAVARIVPTVHGDPAVGLHPIRGRNSGNRTLALQPDSSLTLRIDSDRIREVLPLSGKTLNLGEHRIRIGVPMTKAIVPDVRLYSRLVVIKGHIEPDPFMAAVQRQLDCLGITSGRPSFIEQPEILAANTGKRTGSHSLYRRRTVRVRDKEIVGFALIVEHLSPEESLCLQQAGLGGRRRLGCGIFVPIKTESA